MSIENSLMKLQKSFEWSIKNHKGELDGYNPYDEEYRKVNIEFLEKVKK